MERIKDYGYLQFPLCLIKETYKDIKEGINLMIYYGIVNYAKKLKYSLNDVAKQLCYDYYNKENILQASLKKSINKAIADGFSFYADIDYKGFDNKGKFNPDLNITELLILFDKNSELKKDAILNYQIHLAVSKDHLGIIIPSYDNAIEGYERALKIKNDFEKTFGPDAMPYCKKDMLFDFMDNQKDIDLFRAYIGIKSMIGMRNFVSSNKPAILSRMLGCKNKASFEFYTTNKYNKDKSLLSTVAKYSKRYQMDKLLLTLAERKYIMYLSKKDTRFIYVSKYMEPQELKDLINYTKEKQNLKKKIHEAANLII